MTNPDYTVLVPVVDRSGSMGSMRRDAEGAVRALVADQRKEPGKLTIYLFQFDHEVEEVPQDEIDDYTLWPRGATALYDAIGEAVVRVGERLDAMPEDERPGKVIVTIVTDGQENSSKEWNLARVKTLVTQQQEQYGWQVIFTAANLDAQAVGASLGSVNNMNFAATGAGYRASMGVVGQSISSYRSGRSTATVVPGNAVS